MNPRRVLWLWPALLLLPGAHAQSNAPLSTAVGVTRQITVHAPGPALPAAIAVFAEQLKRDWLQLLDLPDRWRDPIVLVIRDAPRTNNIPVPLRLNILQIGPVVKYEITGAIPPAIEKRELAGAVVQALCHEYANRHHSSVPSTNWQAATVPLWLTRGLAEGLYARPEWLVLIARRSANAARPPDFADVAGVTVMPADDLSREVFCANAWLLTEGLLRLPRGAGKLQRLLDELSFSKTFADAFWRIYAGDFADKIALEKWWILQQARLTNVVVPQNMTAAATAQQLDELLTFPDGQFFRALEAASDSPWLRATLPGRLVDLRNLYTKAHPLYRLALEQYLEAGHLLLAGKISRYRSAVRQAEKLRADADQLAKAISDALDHAEHAYQSPAATNTMQQYLETLKQAEKFEQQRRNPISDYLDKFDK